MTSLSDILSGIKRLDSLKDGRKVSNILSGEVPGRDDIVKDIASLRNHIGKLNAKDRILLLGMFHTKGVFTDPKKPGQSFRDGARSGVLTNFGYDVRSVDDKHHESDYGLNDNKHINGNFNDAHRLIKEMYDKWGSDIRFQQIFLDYFFIPVSSFISQFTFLQDI